MCISLVCFRSRKILRNILLAHEGLEVLMEIVETEGCEEDLFTDAVVSISCLSSHLGIVAPNLKLDETERNSRCLFKTENSETDLTLELDDGSHFEANREKICSGSSVFEAMLTGQFVESGQSVVKLPKTSRGALEYLCHYLYGCRWCSSFEGIDVAVLLELVSLADKYLLTEFNRMATREIVERCLLTDQVVLIYESSLQKEHPVQCVEESLSRCAVNYLLVGAMDNMKRVEVFKELVASKMKGDFIDDVSKILKEKLSERR